MGLLPEQIGQTGIVGNSLIRKLGRAETKYYWTQKLDSYRENSCSPKFRDWCQAQPDLRAWKIHMQRRKINFCTASTGLFLTSYLTFYLWIFSFIFKHRVDFLQLMMNSQNSKDTESYKGNQQCFMVYRKGIQEGEKACLGIV